MTMPLIFAMIGGITLLAVFLKYWFSRHDKIERSGPENGWKNEGYMRHEINGVSRTVNHPGSDNLSIGGDD